ncbi:MAG TPA: MFS transporter [Micromonosporaceae bacterium]|nr:MFS transporter [Micromonosporaceae bacterium]
MAPISERMTLQRDRPTWLIYTQLSVYAYFLYAFAPTVTLLRDEEHVSDAVAGLHGTTYAAGVVVVGLLGARIVARLGRERALWLFLAALCASIAVYASVPSLPVTLVGALVCGGSASGITFAVAAALVERHGSAGPAAMTEANALAAAAGVVGPLAVGGSVSLGYGWRPAVLIVIALIAVLYVCRRAFGDVGDVAPMRAVADSAAVAESAAVVDSAAVVHSAAAPPQDRRRPPLGRQFWLGCTVVVLCVGVEFCMTLWSAQLLRDRSHATPALAATGVTAIVGGMCVGRALGSRLARRYRVDPLLFAAFAVTAVGFTVFWTATEAAVAFTGLAITGLGMALHYPLALSRAIGAASAYADRASSLVTLGGGFAIGAAPFLLGAIADGVTVRYAFLLVPVLLAAATATLVAAHHRPHVDRVPLPRVDTTDTATVSAPHAG